MEGCVEPQHSRELAYAVPATDIDARDDLGMNALEIAIQHRKTVVADWLRKRLAKD